MSRAAAVGVNLETGEVMSNIFTSENYENPAESAWNFIDSIEDDFPDSMSFTVMTDDEAGELLKQSRLGKLGLT